MRQLAILSSFLFIFFVVFGQNPTITFQNTVGATDREIPSKLIQTLDGGHLIVGLSESDASFDKTEDGWGEEDAWIVKFEANGQLEWEKTIGGNLRDHINDIITLPDGGYLVTGWTKSGISGDINEQILGSSDAWIFKLNESGAILWQKFYGGDEDDSAGDILPLENGNFLIAGNSNSNISGEKTEDSLGEYDFWVLIIDQVGNILQQKTIGGSARDVTNTAITHSDGSFILGGYSYSDISIFKSENNIGLADYWVMKINSNLDIVWENTLGGEINEGITEIVETADGAILLVGSSNSPASNDKSENAIGNDDMDDYWIVKIDSDQGEIVWENTIGGDGFDEAWGGVEALDGSVYIGGTSISEISGDKTEDSNWIDVWLLNIDHLTGEIIWQETVGGDGTDYLRSNLILKEDNTFTFSSYTSSPVSGDVTDGTNGNFDYWLVTMSGLTLGSEEDTFIDKISLYPNPVGNTLVVSPNDTVIEVIEIYNAQGMLVKTIEGFSETKNIDVSQLSAGVYFLKIAFDNNLITKKIVKD